MPKRFVMWGCIIAAMLLILAGCSTDKPSLSKDKLNVTTTAYPLYDFAKKIGGDYVNVINLVPAGVEPHDWTPKGRDMVNAKNSNVFLYQGAGFEGWVDTFLNSLDPDSKATPVEVTKGMNLLRLSGEEHHHDEEGAESQESEKGDSHSEFDPHTWLSPNYAKQMGENIKQALIQADADHKDEYEKNFREFAKKLDELDARYKSELSKVSKKEIAVSHQAFGYLCHDYGLEQVAVMGLTPEAEPTAKDIQKVKEFVKDHGIKYIFFEELVSDKLAKTVAQETGAETMVLNPLEGLKEDQLKAGEDYFSIMNSNLTNLVKALQ